MDYYVISSKQSLSYDALALDYFSRAGISDTTEKLAVNTLVRNLKSSANIWASLQGGFFYPVSPTSYGASLHNLISSSFAPSPGASPTFSQNGWSFNAGSSQYLKTGFIPSTDLTINTGGMDVYMRSYTAGNTFFYGSINTAGTNAWGFGLRTAGNAATIHIYNNTGFAPTNSSSNGVFSFEIRSNTDREMRRNGVSLGTTAIGAGGTMPAFETHIGARNVNGTAGAYATCEISTLVQRKIGLSNSDLDLLHSYINTYNSTVIAGGR